MKKNEIKIAVNGNIYVSGTETGIYRQSWKASTKGIVIDEQDDIVKVLVIYPELRLYGDRGYNNYYDILNKFERFFSAKGVKAHIVNEFDIEEYELLNYLDSIYLRNRFKKNNRRLVKFFNRDYQPGYVEIVNDRGEVRKAKANVALIVELKKDIIRKGLFIPFIAKIG